MSDKNKDTKNDTANAKYKIIEEPKINKDNKGLVDYDMPDGSGTMSIKKDSLLPSFYRIFASPYPLSDKEIEKFLMIMGSDNDKQLFIEILKAYAFGAFIPAIISCRALLESLVDRAYKNKNINLYNQNNKRWKYLSEKIKELGVGKELSQFIYFSKFISNKAAHEIFKEYGRNFDKIKATILLSCTLLIIKELKNYVQSTA